MMRKARDAGKGRTANKLRTYMGAAYETGRLAKSKSTIPLAFKAFNISHNPAAETAADESSNKSAKNPLPLEEMRLYWRTIKEMAGFRGALLRLHLLTGAQRLEQLVRLKTCDIEGDVFLIHDGKGRPGQAPRPHLVPLTVQAAEALKACQPVGEYALSTNKGKTHVAAETLSEWASLAAAEAGIESFQAKRLRSGVETLLARVKIPKDDRGRLQSHGITGVQARHYDGHDYIDEKRNAVVALFNVLDAPEASNVVALPSKSA